MSPEEKAEKFDEIMHFLENDEHGVQTFSLTDGRAVTFNKYNKSATITNDPTNRNGGVAEFGRRA